MGIQLEWEDARNYDGSADFAGAKGIRINRQGDDSMTRLTLTFLCGLAILACATTADARNLFRFAQAEELAPPPQNLAAPQLATPYQASQKTPYQAAQKMPYRAAQKGAYQKGQAATCVQHVQHHPRKSICCACETSFQTTLAVYDPCNRCMIDVPVRLPSCCTGAPQAGGRDGLFGQGITNFAWCCGYKVRVVVNKRGDVTVHYYGV